MRPSVLWEKLAEQAFRYLDIWIFSGEDVMSSISHIFSELEKD